MTMPKKALRNSYSIIHKTYLFLSRIVAEKLPVPSASEWLLDNHYIIREQIKLLNEGFKAKLTAPLPLVALGQYKGELRIKTIAVELVTQTSGNIDEKTITTFIEDYQTLNPLTDVELGVLPLMIKFALIERIASACSAMHSIVELWMKAEEIADSFENNSTNKAKALELFFNDGIGPDPAFVEHLYQLLRQKGHAYSVASSVLDKLLEKCGLNSDSITHNAHNNYSSISVSIGSCIISLRQLMSFDWEKTTDSLSVLEKLLSGDPERSYLGMDGETRRYYRGIVSKIAGNTGSSELHVAKTAISLARQGEKHPVSHHVGFYLLDKGKSALWAALEYKPSISELTLAFSRKNPLLIYWLINLIFLLIIMIIPYCLASRYAFTFGWNNETLAALLLSIIPATGVSVHLTNRLVSRFFKPIPLPRMDFSELIPDNCTTLVAVPTLMPDASKAKEQIKRLEAHYLSNKGNNIFFLLMGDFKDSQSEEHESDEAITVTCMDGVAALNAKYCDEGEIKFIYLQRKRAYNENEGCWIAPERKRGGLAQLNSLLSTLSLDGSINSKFFEIRSTEILPFPSIKYVVTLDADTIMPHNMVRKLAGTMAHPLNRPIPNQEFTRVIEGYALLQPKISCDAESAGATLFSTLFTGQAGMDMYTGAISDVYQDLFGNGIFTGKGIYDLSVFHQIMRHVIPADTVLSHDLLEGSYVRAALDSGTTFVDGYPSNYSSYCTRLHRWVRGDWQLLPWLCRKVRDPKETKVKNPLPLQSKWRIFDNLRRSVFPITIFVLIVFSVIFLKNDRGLWIAFSLFCFAFPILPSLVSTFFGRLLHPFSKKHRPYAPGGLNDFLQIIFQIFFIAHQTTLLLDAILKTIFRMRFTRKKMLEWVTAAEAEKSKKGGLTDYALYMKWSIFLVIALTFIISFINPASLFVWWIFLVVWLTAPILAFTSGNPTPKVDVLLTMSQKQSLKEWARKTWLYFECFANEKNNFLPPDNFQEDPFRGAANRTSPTNIGLCLLAYVSALDLGFIESAAALKLIEKTLATIERLEKWNGHLLNWYDTRTLKPLLPRFVSTVDSGNLVCCLITLKQALLEFEEPPEDLIKRIDTLVYSTTFKPLYSEKRQLLSIGFNCEEGKLVNSYYDLFASEARQASFLAIALGDIPVKHWSKLGRTQIAMGTRKGLVSWTGTMFEYLMPTLLMRTYRNTLLDESCRFAVYAQKLTGKKLGHVWGMSESAFYEVSSNNDFQYKAIGVPELGLKRGLGEDEVFSPYSSFLALEFAPRDVFKNLENLSLEGMEGNYGFYESIDFTKSRLPIGRNKGIVKNYMAHHQGMSLLAMANFLTHFKMQNRFHNEGIVRASEILLQEKLPMGFASPQENIERPSLDKELESASRERSAVRRFTTPNPSLPRVHFLSNGEYSVMLTDTGNGYSRVGERYLTRWKSEEYQECGMQVFVKEINSGHVWEACSIERTNFSENCEGIFSSGRARFSRMENGIQTVCNITVLPDENVEIRSVTIKNRTKTRKTLEVTSFIEATLANLPDDLAHPAFSSLFVQTFYNSDTNTLYAARKPRVGIDDGSDSHLNDWHWLGLSAIVDGKKVGNFEFETDRMKFIGRGNTPSTSQAIYCGKPLSGTVGAVIDPILSLRTSVSIEPGSSAKVAFVVISAKSKELVNSLLQKLMAPRAVEQSFRLASENSRTEALYLGVKADDIEKWLDVASHIVFNSPSKNKFSKELAKNTLSQSGLWTYGISGDLPIVTLNVLDQNGVQTVKEALKAHEFWTKKGLNLDLVLLTTDSDCYFRPTNSSIRELIVSGSSRNLIGKQGGIHLIGLDLLSEDERNLLIVSSRIVLSSSNSIYAQLDFENSGAEGNSSIIQNENHLRSTRKSTGKRLREIFLRSVAKDKNVYCEIKPLNPYGSVGRFPWFAQQSDQINSVTGEPSTLSSSEAAADSEKKAQLQYSNSYGGFNKEAMEYEIHVRPGVKTPLPWSNVMANRNFGCIATESGGGTVWCTNSREFRITPWSNDPVCDQLGEMFIFKPDSNKHFNSMLADNSLATCKRVIFGLGYTSYIGDNGGVNYNITQFVPSDPTKLVKVSILSFENTTTSTLKADLIYGFKPVLGISREKTAMHIKAINSHENNVILHNAFCEEFSNLSVWLTSNCEMKTNIASKVEQAPNIVFSSIYVDLQPGQKLDLVILLGTTQHKSNQMCTDKQIRDSGCQFTVEEAFAQLAATKAYWKNIVGQIQVSTPDPSFDLMLNGWLAYQTICCRIFARSAFYQSGGAYGFRDQLQDCMSVSQIAPDIAREQILLHASRQFSEGDVQHWWHPPLDRGTRTKISDDLLWLPYVSCEYAQTSGDTGIWDEQIPFIEAEHLGDADQDKYVSPSISNSNATLYEHCIRAIQRSLRFGPHNFPLIGCGDWNDGMNAVGAKGIGESVWLGWFLVSVLKKMLPICEARGDLKNLELYNSTILSLTEELNTTAWDGNWYLRAWFDDGTPLGSIQNDECRIDVLPQAWSVLSGAGDPAKSAQAMRSLEENLVDYEHGLIKLLSPPFENGTLSPGYIKAYLPGVRENGGQYSHAASWAIIAFAMLGENDKSYNLFSLVNPINHTRTDNECNLYKGEPYVMAGDVYSGYPLAGRAGWTWYTGASGWMYRAGIEFILGIKKEGDWLNINPCIPSQWNEVSIKYTHITTIYEITLRRGTPPAPYPQIAQTASISNISVFLDGALLPDNRVPLHRETENETARVTCKVDVYISSV